MAVRPNPPQHAPAADTATPAASSGLALVPSGAHQGKPALPLTRTFTLLGSRNRAHLHLVSSTVSKSHSAVIVTRSGLYVRDLASRMHTIVNGQVQKEAGLKHGDKLTVGNFSFRVDAKVFANAKPGRMAPKGSLIVQGADFPVLFDGRTVLIGRRPTCDVPLAEESVSTVHALIFEVDGRHYVRDLGSRTGTLVNGKPVHQHPLDFGDELRVGDTVMRFVPEGATEEDYAGGAAALEDEATTAVAPPPVPDWAGAGPEEVQAGTEVAEEIGVVADERLPVAPAAERKAPASEADDLDLIPLAEEESAPVGDWGRVRGESPARPATPAAEAPRETEVEETAWVKDRTAEPVEAGDAEPIDFGTGEEAVGADEGEIAPDVGVVVEREDVSAEIGGERVESVVSGATETSDDLGLEFAEGAEPEPTKAEEPGDLDLSGLSLEPVGTEQGSASAAEAPAAPGEPVAAAPATLADLDLDVPAAPMESLAEAPIAETDEAPAPAPKKSRGRKPAAKKPAAAAKEKPAKKGKEKGKEAWWGRKKNQGQQPPSAPTEPQAPTAEEAPIAPAIAAGAAAEDVSIEAAAAADASLDAATPAVEDATPAAGEAGAITGDDLSFLDDLLAAESAAPRRAATEADEDALEAPSAAEPKLDLSVGDIESGASEFIENNAQATTFAGAAEPTDSLAGLDLSHLATGSGLDLGGVVDSVDLSDETPAGTILPSDTSAMTDVDSFAPAADEASGAAPAAEVFDLPDELEGDHPTAAQRQAAAHPDEDTEVLDFTEPTPESALDLSMPDSPVGSDASADSPALAQIADETLSDTSFGRAVEALADPSLAPVDEPSQASSTATDEVAEAPAAFAQTQADALVAESQPKSADATFDDMLDEVLAPDAAARDEATPEFRFDLDGARAPAVSTDAPAPEPEAQPLSFDEPEDHYETQADKLIAAASTTDDSQAATPRDEDLSSLDDMFADEETAETSHAGATEEPVADELSPDTLAVAEPVEEEWKNAAVVAEEAEETQDAAHTPLITDLTSATEDEAAPEIAAGPAGLPEDEAAEAIDFDLEPAAEEVTSAPAEFTAATVEESEAIDLDALAPEERDQWTGPIDEATLDTNEETSPLAELETPQADAEAAPAAPGADGGHAAPEPARSFDPFLGMARDAGTFIGGMPLPLPPRSRSAPPPSAATAPSKGQLSEPARKPPSPETIQSADDLPTLDELIAEIAAEQGVPPEELARKVNAKVEPIDFTAEPASEATVPAPPAPAPPPEAKPTAPRVVPFQDSPKGRLIPKPPPAARNIPPRAAPAAGHAPAWGPFDLGLGDGAVEIPPFNHTAPGEAPKAGPLTTAFDGLAFDDDDETTDNVFAALGGKPVADPIFGLPSRASAPAAPAGTLAGDGTHGAEPAAQTADEVEAAESPSDSDDDAGSPPSGGPGDDLDALLDDHPASADDSTTPDAQDEAPAAAPAKAGRGRPPGYTPPAPAEAPANPYPPTTPRKRRRWGIKFFLVGMAVSAGAAVFGVYKLQHQFFPRTVEVSGYLKFEGIENLTERQRKLEVDHQRELLKAMPERAREVLMGLNEHLDAGFLGSGTPKDAFAYASIVDSAKVPDGTNKLALYHHGSDKDGDPVRMKALLQALYTKNANLGDELAVKKDALIKAKVDLDSTLREIEERKKRANSGGKLDEAAVLASEQKLSDLKLKDDTLRAEAKRARLRVVELEAELERSIAANDGAAQKTGPAGAVGATPKVPADDAALKEMTQRLADLTAKLDQSKGAKTAEASAAAQKLNQALSQFDKQIAAAQSELKGDDQLVQYVAAAQSTQKQISRIYERLVSQQREFSELLNAKKASLGEKLQARIKEAWANDAQLKAMQETLAVTERHRNAAAASGLTDRLASLDKQIGDLNAQIEARRELIGTGHASAVDVREQQQFVDKLLQMMEKDRANNDKEMAEAFDNFNRQLPSLEKLPEEQKRLATALAQQSAELNTARAQYLKASASESADDTKAIETELAQTQAKVDARKRQIADAAAQDLSTQQQQEREFRIAQARKNLEDAKSAWERTETASSANYTLLGDAKDEAEAAKKSLRRRNEDAKALAALDAQRRDKLALVEKLDQDVKGKIQPLPVDPFDSVAVTLGDDTRPVNALIALIAVFGIFGTLMYVETHQSEREDEDDQAPFAAAAYANEFAEPAPRFADIDEAARAAGLTVNPDPFGEVAPEGGQSVAV